MPVYRLKRHDLIHSPPEREQIGRRPRHSFSRRGLARVISDQDGSVWLEAAIVMPMLILLCFGMIQYSLALFVYNNMFDAARHAARELAVGTSDKHQAKAKALSLLVSWPNGWNVVAEDTAMTGTNEVRVTIAVPGVQASIIKVVPMPDTLQARVVMRRE